MTGPNRNLHILTVEEHILGGEPRFSFTVIDPDDQSLDPNLDPPFADGVTFSPAGISCPGFSDERQ